MAFIGRLREKLGAWVAVFVFVAIGLFILGDLFSSNSMLFNQNDVGEIGGHTISLEEFQQAVKEREASYILNFNRQPGEREMITLRQQAWEMLILKYAIQPQYEKVGLQVTDDEVVDMITGKNVDEAIRQSFINQQTGEFDRAALGNYINQIKSMPVGSEPRVRWEIFERELRPARERIKYENLLIKSAYVTTAQAELEYHLQNDVAEVKYLFVPYYSVSDTSVTVSDSELRSYYNKNKERYRAEHTRDLKYVVFPIIPSSTDTLEVKEEITRMAAELKTAENDSIYAVNNSDNRDAYNRYTKANLPEFIKPSDLTEKNVIGPFIDGSTYKVVKVSKIGKDTTYQARASHILIRWEDSSDASKKAAREKARKILSEIKAGADFATKAREHGSDGTATQGGDLGWFGKGAMVKPFEKAVFSATKPGVLNDVVETEFGYHIINVTEPKDNTYYMLAVIEREITAGDATINEILRKAELFAADLSGVKAFEERAAKEGLQVQEAKGIGVADRRVGNLGEARNIVTWLFREASEGKVSDAFDLTDQYVVAVMTGEIEKGYKPFDLVKEEIRPIVVKEKKGKMIEEKLRSLSGTLDEIAKAYGKDASVYNSSSLKLNSNSLPFVGFEPVIIGKAFSLNNEQRSTPVAGENGVAIVEMIAKTVAPAIGDYSLYRNQLEQTAGRTNTFNIVEAIKDAAGVEDKRYKFY
ncbi:MAG: SurA N-terminal domain-containing protein [Cyclobacteriaceae bacterium]|nr:SurA N-terminal domain-containing protein [Cyclobacteriaceae bacterium]MDW8330306.1 SurA N-terminal domain-containing protein [Cyclobacteriaceae bacterium]